MHQLVHNTRAKVNVTYDRRTGRRFPRWVEWRGIAKVYCFGVNVGGVDMLVRVCHSPF